MQKKIQVALSIEENNIALLCNEWSDWENLKMYLEHSGNNKELEKNVLPDAMLTEGMVDLVVVFDLEQNILFYKNFVQSKGFVDLRSGGIPSGIKRIDREIRGKIGSVKGTIITPCGPLMFVANPILGSNRSTRRKGVLLMGRYVGVRMLERFSSYTDEKIQTLPYEQRYLVNKCASDSKDENMLYFESNDKITLFHVLKDINNTPAVILYTETDNRIFHVLNIHMRTFIVITMSLIFLLGLLLYFSIDRYLLKRMLAISESMGKIEGFEGLSIRITNDREKDEVSHLISNINLTLDRLEQEKVKRENAEKGLLKQGKLASIGRLTSSIAHEINNPLMAISTSIQVIKKIGRDHAGALADPSLFNEAVEISESEVERIRDIISGLLDFHRLDKEGFTRVNLKDVVLQSISILSWSKKLELIETVLELEENVFIYCSPVKIKQVLINFILNAAEAMKGKNVKENPGNKGKLKIMVVQPSAGTREHTARQYAEIHLIDNGPGLSPLVKKTLFEPFVTTKEDKGVGLGLYISYKIIEQHDGEIIYDENCREGTHFIIKLPMDRRKEERITLSPIPTL
ncbi:MAG TPA: CHASE4 domain-containing protein [Candidatus Deferrimicrobium sp.]|nr:CHASE4 domain-containing protein [Candidatus Deferrimicrobium sp.]